jgi:hypothetical protein
MTLKTIKTKAIPRTETDVLRAALAAHHDALHTPEGLAKFSGPRRDLINRGMKGIKIARELHLRGFIPTPCRFCLPDIFLPPIYRKDP